MHDSLQLFEGPTSAGNSERSGIKVIPVPRRESIDWIGLWGVLVLRHESFVPRGSETKAQLGAGAVVPSERGVKGCRGIVCRSTIPNLRMDVTHLQTESYDR